jgi:hypothetical protein
MPVERSETIELLATALSKAQGDFPAVQMNSTNPFFHSKYADLGSVVQASKAILAKYELSFSQIVFNDDLRVGVTTVLMHSSGQWISSSMSLPLPPGETKTNSLAQAVGGLITYMRRYALSAILGISTEEDKDGNDRKSKASAASQDEEKTPERDLVDKILKKCTALGGSKNPELLVLLREFEPSANPNKIKDLEKLKELDKKLTEMK